MAGVMMHEMSGFENTESDYVVNKSSQAKYHYL